MEIFVTDIKEREFLDSYMKAYEDIINNTSTKWHLGILFQQTTNG